MPRADVLVLVKDMFGEGALSLFRGVCTEATGSALVAPGGIHTSGGIFRTLFDHFWDHVFCHCLGHFWITFGLLLVTFVIVLLQACHTPVAKRKENLDQNTKIC